MTERHDYLRPVLGATPNTHQRLIAAYLLNSFLAQSKSVSQWKRTRPFEVRWQSNRGPVVGRVDFTALVGMLHDQRQVDGATFGLPPFLSPLFDSLVDVGLPQAMVGSDGGTVVMRLPMAMGASFPLVPQIDRDGFAAADMQVLVETNIVSLFHQLVRTSHDAPQPRSGWLTAFRMLVGECITSVDMLLHKVHLLAEYRGAELGWQYDAVRMGSRHGRRLMDKFGWVTVASGRPFSLTPSTHRAFRTLKDLRNHLAHFDPPCFAATLEELCGWLNLVPTIGDVHWSIRKHLRQQLSETTIQLLLLPRLAFHPDRRPFGRDAPPPDRPIGYASASWPRSE
jgi:hypothetical protein